MFFSLRDQYDPVGIDALAHKWLQVLLYAFSTVKTILPTLPRAEMGISLILIAPHWPGKH